MSAPTPVHLARATALDVPSGRAWLTEEEVRVHGELRFPLRAADWRLGRWVAKRAVAAALGLDARRPEEIEVLATPGGAPSARVVTDDGAPAISLSLSHSHGMGFAAATTAVVRLGCDVETIEPRSAEFVGDYFTEPERTWIEAAPRERDLRANLLWSAKEAALKALGEGLRLDTRSVEVEAIPPANGDPSEWRALAVDAPDGRTFPGLWRVQDGRAWTVVAEEPIRVV
jgi:4'-phosphopantetheinyl transferase